MSEVVGPVNVYVVDPNKVFVVPEFTLVLADSLASAKLIKGKVLGRYLTNEAAQEAIRTMLTVGYLGYRMTTKE